jgi:hypothetical protein
MGFLDALRGKTPQSKPQLDDLFALPTAALTLESQLDLVSSSHAGLCFKAGSGESEHENDTQLRELLNLGAGDETVTITADDMGYKWLVVTDPDLSSLVTRIHQADTVLIDNGFGARLLCAVFGFVPKSPPGEGAVRLVYLMQTGTFYPFAPRAGTTRDNELELRVRNFVDGELKIEKNLTRWMALWGLPVD